MIVVGCKILLAASKGLPFLHSSHVTIVDVRRHFGILVFYSAECDCKALDDVRCRISCLRLDAVKRDVTWLVVARARFDGWIVTGDHRPYHSAFGKETR